MSEKTYFKKLTEWVNPDIHPFLGWILWSVFIGLILEIFSRRSILDAAVFVLDAPLEFAINVLIIMAPFSLAFLTKRVRFVRVLISVLFLLMGIADFVLLLFRTTPFNAQDFLQIGSALRVAEHYISFFALILIGLLFVLVAAGLVLIWRKAPVSPHRMPFKKSIPAVALSFGAVVFLFSGVMKTTLLPARFSNIAQAYQDYGLVYCFVSSMVNTGITRPEQYAEEAVEKIMESQAVTEMADIPVDDTRFPEYRNHPTEPERETDEQGELLLGSREGAANVIFVQLESFYDVTKLTNLELSEDPMPTLHRMQEEFSCGKLSVPGVGAGTANTEFEVMTGINLDFFGPGEYPYQTVLQNKTCESLGFVFAKHGYTAQAIHNNSACFYDRNNVFPQLGYQVFTSLEYMNDLTWTETGWAKDKVLTQYISRSLRATTTKDFIYTISVQGHGAYPTHPVLAHPVITATARDEDGEPDDVWSNQYTYYVNQEYEMDRFVRDLTGTLRAWPEPCVVVFFGDHLPALGITEENMREGGIYQTDYILWSNFEMERIVRDVEAYQLGAYVMQRINLSDGVMFRYHQRQLEEPQDEQAYQDGIAMLGYDMLYGDESVYGGKNPYSPTRLKMGTDPITIDSVSFSEEDDELTVTGENFTAYSILVINGKQYEPTDWTESSLTLEDPPSGDLAICVAQLDDYGKAILSTTKTVRRRISGR